jgi:hypothetical protein
LVNVMLYARIPNILSCDCNKYLSGFYKCEKGSAWANFACSELLKNIIGVAEEEIGHISSPSSTSDARVHSSPSRPITSYRTFRVDEISLSRWQVSKCSRL